MPQRLDEVAIVAPTPIELAKGIVTFWQAMRSVRVGRRTLIVALARSAWNGRLRVDPTVT